MERAGLWRARVNRFRGGTGMKISWIWAVSLGLALSVFGAAASAAPAIPWTPPVGHGAVQLVDTAVEEMPPIMESAYIRGIQQELALHGYRPGAVDGRLGGGTRRAIRDYQRDAGLKVDGAATRELLDHLKFAQPKVRKRFKETPGKFAVQVQQGLKPRGYYRATVDGITGPKTRAAIRAFQKDAGLPVTGSIDQNLVNELRAAAPDVRVN